MAEVTVRFKGLFQQITGCEEKRIALSEPTLEGLVRALEGLYGRRFTEALRDPGRCLSPGVTAFVGKRQFPGWDTPLADEEEVTFLHFIVGG